MRQKKQQSIAKLLQQSHDNLLLGKFDLDCIIDNLDWRM